MVLSRSGCTQNPQRVPHLPRSFAPSKLGGSARGRAAAIAALWLMACAQPNAKGLRDRLADGGAPDGGPLPDVPADTLAVDKGGMTGPPDAPAPLPDVAAPVDAPGPDTAPPPECTLGQVDCSAEGRPRTCSEQGSWTLGAACPAQTACSAGQCLCPAGCDLGPVSGVQMPGLVEDLTAGGRFLFLAISGPNAGIRRVNLDGGEEADVERGQAGVFTRYGLQADTMGTLLWCSDAMAVGGRTGQLVYGTMELETGWCIQVRRREGLVYYLGPQLLRKPLDSSPPEVVSSESMVRFELTRDHVYFVGGNPGRDAFLKRLPLADPGATEPILNRDDLNLLALLADGSHVYLTAAEKILRVPQAAGATAEVFWEGAGTDPFGLAQTDSHVYWSTTTSSNSGCTEARVWRRPKSGGTALPLTTRQGVCASRLVVHDGYLYAVFFPNSEGFATSQIFRIRL
jgi:hypothetical protein